MTIELRDYQETAVAEIREEYRKGKKAVLFALPTGGGKTVTFSYMVAGALLKSKRSLLLVHRRELVDQASKTFTQFGVEHGVIMSGRSGNNLPVQIAMVGSIIRRLDKIKPPDFIVIDEAHHATAATYKKIIAAFPKAKILGVTATPQRTDGTGLGEIFDALVQGPAMRDLIDRGALSDYRIFIPPQQIDTSRVNTVAGDYNKKQIAAASDRSIITGDAVAHYQRLCTGQAVAFCVSVEHAQHVAEHFNGAGIPAARVDGGMSAGERSETLARYAAGEIRVLTSADLISEGFDLPAIQAAILLRPTKSIIVYLQQVGRALRPFPGKNHAIILDHSGNSLRLGFPDEPREWSLEGSKGKKEQQERLPVAICRECFAAYSPNLNRCPHCDAGRPEQVRTVDYQDGELIELGADEIWRRSAERRGDKIGIWPGHAVGNVLATFTKCTASGQAGVKIMFRDGAGIFRSYASLKDPMQIRAVQSALGFKPGWAARTWWYNHHDRDPTKEEFAEACATVGVSRTLAKFAKFAA